MCHTWLLSTCVHLPLPPSALCDAQSTSEPRVEWVEEQLRELSLSDAPPATGLVQGNLCVGKFSLDDSWCVVTTATIGDAHCCFAHQLLVL